MGLLMILGDEKKNSKMGESPSGERERKRARRNGFGERKGEYL